MKLSKWKCPYCEEERVTHWKFGKFEACDYCIGKALEKILKIGANKESNVIKTKDLVEYMKQSNAPYSVWSPYLQIEYMEEIVARLKAHDKLKEDIESLIATMSNGGDK